MPGASVLFPVSRRLPACHQAVPHSQVETVHSHGGIVFCLLADDCSMYEADVFIKTLSGQKSKDKNNQPKQLRF